MRWQELFHGAERRLIDREAGGVHDPEETMRRFWHELDVQRRRKLMPFFWNVLAKQGQVFGDPRRGSEARVTPRVTFSASSRSPSESAAPAVAGTRSSATDKHNTSPPTRPRTECTILIAPR